MTAAAVITLLGLAFAVLSIVGRALSPGLGGHALDGRRVRLWKASCLAAALLPVALLLVAIQWLAVLSLTRWLETPHGHIIGEAIAFGVLGTIVFELWRSGSTPYWAQVHRSLDLAIEPGSPRRIAFNRDHALIGAGGPGAKSALRRVLRD
jgi:hypothetical protein